MLRFLVPITTLCAAGALWFGSAIWTTSHPLIQNCSAISVRAGSLDLYTVLIYSGKVPDGCKVTPLTFLAACHVHALAESERISGYFLDHHPLQVVSSRQNIVLNGQRASRLGISASFSHLLHCQYLELQSFAFAYEHILRSVRVPGCQLTLSKSENSGK